MAESKESNYLGQFWVLVWIWEWNRYRSSNPSRTHVPICYPTHPAWHAPQRRRISISNKDLLQQRSCVSLIFLRKSRNREKKEDPCNSNTPQHGTKGCGHQAFMHLSQEKAGAPSWSFFLVELWAWRKYSFQFSNIYAVDGSFHGIKTFWNSLYDSVKLFFLYIQWDWSDIGQEHSVKHRGIRCQIQT